MGNWVPKVIILNFQEESGGVDGALPSNFNHLMDSGIHVEKDRHGKCIVFNSLPLVEDQLENLAQLPPFDLLVDHLPLRVINANPEQTPEVDLSKEATAEFYEHEDFSFGPTRWEFERRTVSYHVG